MKNRFRAVLAVGLLTAPFLANAALVTQLIHFDDASNGWKWYSDADRNFLFDPTNLQSSVQCADSTSGGNGSCVIEGTQGVLPKMTRPTNGTLLQGSASADPYDKNGPGPGANQLFTLNSFYFLLTGNGTGSENAITVTGSNLATFTFQLGTAYVGNPAVTFYEGVSKGLAAGELVKLTGYVVTFGDLFKDVTSIQFSAPDSAQVRLDCVVASFDGTTSQGLTSGTTCGTGPRLPDPVPLPAAAWLLISGLGGLGLLSRRRKAA